MSEKEYYHCTTQENLDKIIAEGFLGIEYEVGDIGFHIADDLSKCMYFGEKVIVIDEIYLDKQQINQSDSYDGLFYSEYLPFPFVEDSVYDTKEYLRYINYRTEPKIVMNKTEEIDRADKILNAKESYDFLKGAKRILVKVAMEEHTNQALSELEEQVREYYDNLNQKSYTSPAMHRGQKKGVFDVLELITKAKDNE